MPGPTYPETPPNIDGARLDLQRILGLAVAMHTQVDLESVAQAAADVNTPGVSGAMFDIIREANAADPGVARKIIDDAPLFVSVYQQAKEVTLTKMLERRSIVYALIGAVRPAAMRRRVGEDWLIWSAATYRGMLTGARLEGQVSSGAQE